MSRQQTRTSYTNRTVSRPTAYVEGNTVRKLNTLPEREHREVREREENRQAERAARANRQKAMQMSPGYILFLTMAVLMTVAVCIGYIQLQSEINGRMRNIATLESQILDLKTDNDATLKRIETSVNLDDIKNVAMNEMGMVYPGEDQIVYFTVDTSDYMNQYQDIPEK